METDRAHHIAIAASHLIRCWLDLDDGREVFAHYSRGEMTAHIGRKETHTGIEKKQAT